MAFFESFADGCQQEQEINGIESEIELVTGMKMFFSFI